MNPAVLDRFVDKIEIQPDGCWRWTGCILRSGYGQFATTGGQRVRAHRFAYEWLVGPIPEGLTLDHLCRNIACVNPGHCEPVTSIENVMRGSSPPAQNARKTRCKRGHMFSPENTYVAPNGVRECRTCKRRSNLAGQRRRRAARGGRL